MVSEESKTSSRGNDAVTSQGTPSGGKRRGAREQNGERKKARPLDQTTLRDLALSYAARFSTTAAKVEGYLARKIRERGVAEDADGRTLDLDVAGLVTRLIELGYVDDDAYARTRSRDLTARGFGKRRVEQVLWAAGVEEQTRASHAPGEGASRRAAMLLAKKRRLGPFGDGEPQKRFDTPDARAQAHKLHEKQVAAILRAGHVYEHARFILTAADAQQVEDWVIEAEDKESADDW